MKSSPIIESFNSGEWSPLLVGRTGLKTYNNACRRMRNFVPTRQGPARRRPGTRFAAEVKLSANRTWLGKFKFNTLQAYVLEFGHQYIRFYSNHGVVGAPLEVATPYTSADLTGADGTFQLRFVQSNDVLYIVHPSYQPQKLQRTGAAAFNLTAMAPTGGPFKKVDLTTGITVYASAATGAGITLTASAALFTANMVGALFYLEQKQVDSIQMWETGKVRAINDVRRSDGKNFHALNAATTGTVKPTHNTGARYDGDGGVQWQYDDPGYGWVQITGFTDTTHVTATVLSRIPDNAVGAGNATLRWALGAWNATDGYPDNVTFFRERLCFSRARTVWQSNAGDFENFKAKTDDGLITAECAITSDITSDQANNIQWFAPSDIALLVGTAGDEAMLSEISTAQALGPGNIRARKQAEYGARHVPVIRIGDAILFTQASGRKVRAMQFSWQKEGYVGVDLTVLAQHITKGGLIDAAFQQEPDSVGWFVRTDGALVGLTYDQEQEVRAWHQHRLGGYNDAAHTVYAVVESVVAIPAPNNDRDEIWMIVNRSIGGVTKRYVEYMETFFEEGDDPEDAFHVDCGLTLDNKKNAILTLGTEPLYLVSTTGELWTLNTAHFGTDAIGQHLILDGVDGHNATSPNAASFVVGDLDIRVKIAPTIWALGAREQYMISRSTGAPDGWIFGIAADGRAVLYGSFASAIWDVNAYSTVVIPFAAGTVGWVRVTRTVAGVITFYYSNDNVAWTQLGAQINGAAGNITTVGNIDVGGYSPAGAWPPAGKCYFAEVRNGIDGIVVAKFDPSTVVLGNATTKGAKWLKFSAPAMFAAGNVGRKIHYRYSTVSVTGKIVWNKAVVEITNFIDAGNVVGIVRKPFPNMTAIAANGWRMTSLTVSGMNHAIGETVQVWADGSAHPDQVVDGTGSITLQANYDSSKVHVGFGCPAVLQPMPIEAGSQNGTARGKKQRMSRVGIGFHNSVGVQYGRDEDKKLDRLPTRGGGDNMDEAPPLFTGIKTVSWPDGYDEETGALITIIADQAGPCTITHLTPQVETFDDR